MHINMVMVYKVENIFSHTQHGLISSNTRVFSPLINRLLNIMIIDKCKVQFITKKMSDLNTILTSISFVFLPLENLKEILSQISNSNYQMLIV
jgi:hypothetical protein